VLEKEFKITTVWSGNHNSDTSEIISNSKNHKVFITHKPELNLSAAKEFKGDKTKHNPEDLFLSALSSCHMMSYMYLCNKHNIKILNYTDETLGKLKVEADGSGAFISVELYPIVTILDKNEIDLAISLHKEANRLCFIANSCSVPISHFPQIIIAN
jgi:organic hydroperoxide reductase OsmC/OhrA